MSKGKYTYDYFAEGTRIMAYNPEVVKFLAAFEDFWAVIYVIAPCGSCVDMLQLNEEQQYFDSF